MKKKIKAFCLGFSIMMIGMGITLAHANYETPPIPDWPQSHAIAMHGHPKHGPGFDHLSYANPDAPKGGVVKRGEVGSFDSFHPHLLMGQPPSSMNDLSYWDPLMKRAWGEPFTLYASVAEKVAVTPDRSGITFFLNPRARFHDGSPILAKDVVFSHAALMNNGRPNTRRIYKLVNKVIVHDDHTVTFMFGDGYDQETALILAMMPVMPKHYYDDPAHDVSKTTLTPPLGSGPYKITEFEQGRRIVYERVKDYWAADLGVNVGHYNADRLIYDYYRDTDVAMQAFTGGAFDIQREWNAHRWVRDYNFDDQSDIIKGEFKHGRPAWARFMIFNTRRPIFDDMNVRRALGLAFDFEWVNKNLFNGAYQRLDSIFANSELADGSFIPPATDGSGPMGLRANLRRAAAILKTAGWKMDGGVMTNMETGQPLVFGILLNNPTDEKIALEYARNLKKLGIVVTVRTVDSAQYIRQMQEYDYDMTINYWRNSLSPGTEQAVYWGSAAADIPGGLNYAGVQKPAIDAIIDSLTTAQKREDLVSASRALDRAVMNGWYGIPLYYTGYDYVAYRDTVAHPDISSLYGPVLETWWVNPSSISNTP